MCVKTDMMIIRADLTQCIFIQSAEICFKSVLLRTFISGPVAYRVAL